MTSSALRPRGRLACLGLTLGAGFTAVNAWYLVSFVRGGWTRNDWFFYYVGATIGRRDGWSRLYDFELQRRLYHALVPTSAGNPLYLYVSPPPLAFLVVPLTWLGPLAGYLAWVLAGAAVFAIAARVALPPRQEPRWREGLLVTAFLPVAVTLQKGQPVLLVAAFVLAAWALLDRRREVSAGLLLAGLVLKPQLGFLLPAVLLVSGRWRAALAATLACAAVLAVTALPVGLPGLLAYVHQLVQAGQAQANQAYTLASLGGPAAMPLRAAAAVAALAAAWRHRRAGPAVVIALGVVGSLLASPYLHLEDFAMLVVAAWAAWRGWSGRWVAGAAVLALAGVEAAAVLPPAVGLLPLMLWLLAMLVVRPAGVTQPAPAPARSSLEAVGGPEA